MFVVRLLVASILTLYLAACQTTGSTGNITALTVNTPAKPAALMAVGREVVAPFGYIGFCQRNPADCKKQSNRTSQPFKLTAARLHELKTINDQVNRSIRPVEDRRLYDREEWWTYPTNEAGDCEDYALLKRKLLIQRGWPEEALLISVVKEWSGSGHAVLLASTDKGEFVLDNQNWNIIDWQDAPYTWVKRQSKRNPFAWVSITPNTTGLATASAEPTANPNSLATLRGTVAESQNNEPAARTFTSAMAN